MRMHTHLLADAQHGQEAYITTTTLALGGWDAVFTETLSSGPEDGREPVEHANMWFIWYIIFGVMIFMHYLRNLFAGLVFESYINSQTSEGTGVIMSVGERRLITYEIHLRKVKPLKRVRKVKPGSLIHNLRDWMGKPTLKLWVFRVLMLNIVMDVIESKDQAVWVTVATNVVKLSTCVVLMIEAVLHLLAGGWCRYFQKTSHMVYVCVLRARHMAVSVSVSGPGQCVRSTSHDTGPGPSASDAQATR